MAVRARILNPATPEAPGKRAAKQALGRRLRPMGRTRGAPRRQFFA